MLTSPGHFLIPRVQGGTDLAASVEPGGEIGADENERFERWVTSGEESEYRARDFAGAMRAYREAGARVSSPRLRAMAESYVGRVQLKNGDAAPNKSGRQEMIENVLNRYLK